MDSNLARIRWNGVVRAACGMALAGAIGLLLTNPDIAAEARDGLLGVFTLWLAVTALASDERESPDEAPRLVAEETSWHEHEGSFRGMVG